MKIAVIGGGLVGMHIANSLNDAGHEVWLLERERNFGHHTSSRNSGVIHAGIFYNDNSLKERSCLDGNKLTYAWAIKLGIRYKKTGKLIIAEHKDLCRLLKLQQKANSLNIKNKLIYGCMDINFIENIIAEIALHIEDTGIIDVAQYLVEMEKYLVDHDVMMVNNCNICEVQGNRLVTNRGNMQFDIIINSCGLWSDDTSKQCGIDGYEIRPMRGDYAIIPYPLVTMPVYGLPDEDNNVLGVHLTPTMDHQVLIGPNAYFIQDKHNYKHNTDICVFIDSIKHLFYNLKINDVRYSYSGNRPKLFKDGVMIKDFQIIKHNNWIHLLGIESPGLTSAPALGNYVRDMI